MFALEPERKKRAEEIVAGCPEKRAALLPLLWLVKEQDGWLSPEALALVSKMAGVTEAEAHEVASFYTLFDRKRVGRLQIQLCVGPCCSLMGAGAVLSRIKTVLGIEVGETTPDGAFTLSTVECLGSCGTAPVMQVGDDHYEGLREDGVEDLIGSLRRA